MIRVFATELHGSDEQWFRNASEKEQTQWVKDNTGVTDDKQIADHLALLNAGRVQKEEKKSPSNSLGAAADGNGATDAAKNPVAEASEPAKEPAKKVK